MLNSHPSSSADGSIDVAVRLVQVRKTYGEVVAVERLSLEVLAGEFFTMLGPSGSGKTTTLRVRLGQQLPQVNVVVMFVIAITIVPIALAQGSRATQECCAAPRRRWEQRQREPLLRERPPPRGRPPRERWTPAGDYSAAP